MTYPYKYQRGDSVSVEPKPTEGTHEVGKEVIKDIEDRIDLGLSRYGSLLKTFNNRDSLVDLYQELIDGCMYVKQKLMETEEIKEELRILIGITRSLPSTRTNILLYNKLKEIRDKL
jgi:hypothetical protein